LKHREQRIFENEMKYPLRNVPGKRDVAH